MKKCIKCLQTTPFQNFHKKKGAKDGFFQWCIPCHRHITKTRLAERRKNLGFAAAENERVKAWHRAHPGMRKQMSKKYAETNASKILAKVKKYRCSKENRTPKWLTQDDLWIMEEAYALAKDRTKMFGFPWEVDHVIPLHGKLVSGLHTPVNLQVIPMICNRVKSNTF